MKYVIPASFPEQSKENSNQFYLDIFNIQQRQKMQVTAVAITTDPIIYFSFFFLLCSKKQGIKSIGFY